MPLDMTAASVYIAGVQQHQQESGRRDILNYKFRPGQNRGRLLPPWPGSGELAMHVWHHTKVPPKATHYFCWENMYPGRGIQCPICAVCKNLRVRGLEPWQQEAWDCPQTNWIDRQPLDQFNQPMTLERNPGPQVIDLDVSLFNYFMSIAVTTQCDITALDLGYDVIINYDPSQKKKKDAFTPMMVPGQASYLHPNPVMAKTWISQCYDIRQLKKMPNWQDPKGQNDWQRLCSSARELEMMYIQGATQGAVPGYGPGQPGQPPVDQFPQQLQMPQFTQPSAGVPTAPPPLAASSMMGAPGSMPFGPGVPVAAPPPAPPTQAAPPMAPPQMPSPAPPLQPQAQYPAPPAMPALPSMPAMPAMPAQVASPVAMTAAQPLTSFAPPPPMPAQAAPLVQDARPSWEQAPVPVPPIGPGIGMNLGPVIPPPMPAQAAPPLPVMPAPGPILVSTSADGKPPCFAHSRLDMTVEYGATGQAAIRGGYSEFPSEVGYRCMMCSHQLDCGAKAQTTYPNDYAKDATGSSYMTPKTA